MLPIAILNMSIASVFGTYTYTEATLDEVKDLIKDREILSAVGHESTSEILSELLEVEVPVNRINFAQEVGQKAIVFRAKGRVKEGCIFTRQEIEQIGYTFGVLERNA
jgi:hypothetical protein